MFQDSHTSKGRAIGPVFISSQDWLSRTLLRFIGTEGLSPLIETLKSSTLHRTMGIPTGDLDGTKGNDCAKCFAAGETPDNMYARVVGIKAGATWLPGDAPPPNGEWKLTQIANPCRFSLNDPPYGFILRNDAGQTIFRIAHVPFGAVFNGVVAAECIRYFENLIAVPAGNKFYGGKCQICFIPGDDIPALHHVEDQLNIEHSSDTFMSDFPLSATETVFRLGRRFDSTNILIKTDL